MLPKELHSVCDGGSVLAHLVPHEHAGGRPARCRLERHTLPGDRVETGRRPLRGRYRDSVGPWRHVCGHLNNYPIRNLQLSPLIAQKRLKFLVGQPRVPRARSTKLMGALAVAILIIVATGKSQSSAADIGALSQAATAYLG